MKVRSTLSFALASLLLVGCGAAPDADAPGSGDQSATSTEADDAIAPAPGADEAAERLRTSPRHAEWAAIPAGAGDSVRAWVVYPERSDPAPVVLVVHEIYGLTEWVRATADQLAAEGFIAIAPDMLTGADVPTTASGDPERDAAVRAVRALDPDDVHRRLARAAEWGAALPAAGDRHGIIGFCWGGSTAFAHATRSPGLDAAVVYYGSSPDSAALARVEAPVLGLYGGDDARVNATIPPADSAMNALGKPYEVRIHDGAGHGFLRQQDGRDGANRAASREAWPETVRWLRRHLETDR